MFFFFLYVWRNTLVCICSQSCITAAVFLGMYSNVRTLFKYGVAPLASLYCVQHCVTEYIVDIVITTGVSMEPVIKEGDIFLLSRSCVRNQSLNPGDIIVSKSPVQPKDHICKRVVGLAGDTMSHHRADGCTYKYIPKGHVWLEGDNKEMSKDSRDYGPVPYGLILGRLFFRVYPIKTSGWFPPRDSWYLVQHLI